MLFVPLGHTIIAHRFIGGIEHRIGRKAPPRGERPAFKDGILQIFVISVVNLSSLSGLDYLTGHSPTVETVAYYRASQGDEEPQPNPLTTGTFCLHKNYFRPLFSRRKMHHGVARWGFLSVVVAFHPGAEFTPGLYFVAASAAYSAGLTRLPATSGGGLFRDCRGRVELLFQRLASHAVCRFAESALLPHHDR